MTDRYLNLTEILHTTTASAATVWRWERDGKFPKRRKLGPRRVGWLESEVQDWINQRAGV